MSSRLSLFAFVAAACTVSGASALDHVVVRRGETEQTLIGRILLQDETGALLLQGRDGTLAFVTSADFVSKSSDDVPFKPLTPDEAAAAVLAQLPPGFEVYQTKHYVLCYNTSRAYAQWCGTLFERLYQGFQNFWTNRGLELHEPEFPLVAVVFSDRTAYTRYARPEVGDGIDSIIGYYSPTTNRMTMYDLTGAAGTTNDRVTSAQINTVLARPEAAKTVATIVHEATHQIAYNCGLHQRYSDIPLWVSEGIAVYFETPDLTKDKGWSTIGAVHRTRLLMFRAYMNRRPADSLETLIRDDDRMRNAQSAGDAYAEAWALNYFLINARSQQYRDYLKLLAAKGPSGVAPPETRLAEFRNAFGDDLTTLDRDFLRFISRLR